MVTAGLKQRTLAVHADRSPALPTRPSCEEGNPDQHCVCLLP